MDPVTSDHTPSASSTPHPSSSSSLPLISAAEQSKKDAFDAYGLKLSMWLRGQGLTSAADFPNALLAGNWTVDDGTGYFVITDGEFRWYEDGAVTDDNYYAGSYDYMPGAQTNSGYVLDHGEGNECYSIFQHYTSEKVDGVERAVNYYGVFIVERQGTPDSLYVVNQRTGGEMTLTRAA